MELGDLVLYKQRRWLVERRDKMTRTMFLRSRNRDVEEIPENLDLYEPDTVKVIANPGKQWKVLAAPLKPGAGPFVRFVVPAILGKPEVELEPWKDWISSDPSREGGSIFVRPGTKLKTHTIVMLTHQNGHTVRVKVPGNFSTTAAKQKAATPPPPPPNRFDRMMDDD